mmetsp:Transcript_20962/g.28839  ORF Transcript_20962/g.28839 Transcript_20962/m.28839 type:complete len:101 (+) Transcript_20962:394-696(+)
MQMLDGNWLSGKGKCRSLSRRSEEGNYFFGKTISRPTKLIVWMKSGGEWTNKSAHKKTTSKPKEERRIPKWSCPKPTLHQCVADRSKIRWKIYSVQPINK